MKKYTPWFNCAVKPKRVGAYQVRCSYFDAAFDRGERRFWDGNRWSDGRSSFGTVCLKDQWRGLAKKP